MTIEKHLQAFLEFIQAFSSSGFNLELHVSSGDGQDQSFTRDKVDLESEPPKVGMHVSKSVSHYNSNSTVISRQLLYECV